MIRFRPVIAALYVLIDYVCSGLLFISRFYVSKGTHIFLLLSIKFQFYSDNSIVYLSSPFLPALLPAGQGSLSASCRRLFPSASALSPMPSFRWQVRRCLQVAVASSEEREVADDAILVHVNGDGAAACALRHIVQVVHNDIVFGCSY